MAGVPLAQGHPQAVAEIADLEGSTQASVAYTGTAGVSSALAEGVYHVWSDQDCYLQVAPDPSGVTSSNGYILFAKNVVSILVRVNSKIGVIRSAVNGTLYYHKVG